MVLCSSAKTKLGQECGRMEIAQGKMEGAEAGRGRVEPSYLLKINTIRYASGIFLPGIWSTDQHDSKFIVPKSLWHILLFGLGAGVWFTEPSPYFDEMFFGCLQAFVFFFFLASEFVDGLWITMAWIYNNNSSEWQSSVLLLLVASLPLDDEGKQK